MKVLVVDDSKMSRRVLQKSLPEALKERAEIFEASNGIEAMKVVGKESPELIFLDLTMPEMDGYAVLEALKEQGVETEVIVVSADVQSGSEERVTELGARCHLQKPVSKEALFPHLKDIIAKQIQSS